MLIPSERHTAADLDLWRDLEEADALLGEPSRVAESIDAIERFARGGPCYASVSWGKDSVCLAHLLWRVAPNVPVVHLAPCGWSDPYWPLVRDNFLARFPLANYRDIEIDYGSANERGKDHIFFATLRRCGQRYLSGVRASESGGRLIRMRHWGLTSKNACAPLGWWRTSDVFGYLAHHGLPVHPNYAMLGGGRWDRECLRVDELGGERGSNMGRAEWEREYYGDCFARTG